MGANFTGITFDDCNVSPSDDGLINRTILPDGILSGCEISYSGSTLTMASGTLIACGRQFRHPAAQNWAVVDATTGYARLLITLDLTRSATDQTFDQVVDAVEYANDISGFPALVQQDLNAAGTKYQIVACVVSLGTGGISGIINTMPTVHPASAGGGTLTVTAPAGSTVTVSKDGKTLTRVAGADGVVVFRGLETGTWTLSITDGEQTASKPVDIVADYATSITFFMATIHITYPAGSVCTATDGTTTLTSPDTSGTWDCVVPNAGAWAVTVTDKGWTDTAEITQDGQVANIYLDKLYLYKGGVVRNAYFVHNGAVTNENGKLIARMGNNANQALLFYFTESISGINSIQIKAHVISTGSGYHTAFVSKYDIYSSATNNKLSAVDMPATSDERVYSIDLSGINDPIYLWFMFNAQGTDANVEISEIGGI